MDDRILLPVADDAAEGADAHDCDVVVTATHGRPGIGRGPLVGVTERVMGSSDAPAVAAPRE